VRIWSPIVAELSFIVTLEESGERLDVVLAERLPDISRSQIQRGFAEGQATVDGKPRPKSFRVEVGAQVVFPVPALTPAEAVPQDLPLNIVYADDDLVIVDKPAGLVTHPAPGHSTGTLVNALLFHCRGLAATGDPLRPGLVHRLDRDTSGLLAVALSARALKSLAAQLKDRTLGRTYLALSWGDWTEDAGTLSGDIGRHARDRQRMAVVERGGREAVTHYEVVDDLGFVQLCRVKLATGRTHQIRVHFAHNGHPVVGDAVYGDDRRALNVRPVDRSAATRLIKGVCRQFLHAAELELRHPADGRLLTATSPLPADLAGPLARLRADVAATA
jgi:23S rRNA pseudouridine1911/1915/1917 synthase